MKNSNIIDFLKENTVADRKSLILDVALGMSYLHDSGVVHGRIHGKNILITHDPLRACLSDFGLAVLPVDSGAAPFLAPELGVSGLPCPTRTTASDVFAFSTASYEIFTSSKPEFIPWSNPSKPDDSEIDEVTWLILLGAWQRDPKMRSSAGQIVEELEKIIKSREQRTDQLKSVLKIIFKESEYYRQFLSCAEADAQEVLDTVQSLLDTSNLPLEDRNQLIVAMRRLSEQTELYPSRFSLNCPLSKPEEEPIAWGAFADAYAREVINWGQLSHPNILPFYGLSRLGSRLCLVSRWAKNGNLSAYLQTDPNASRVLLVCIGMSVQNKP
ncbi:hypothetical protein C0993_006261 [Termitomyces sp. T159_Od127]|nr:hypothetical protein C0993_006261 [Termitomyces sp. T159_Od127]